MKKIILSAAILAICGLTVAKANFVVLNPAATTIQQDTVTTPVDLQNLPDPVKKTLEDPTFKEWVPTTASDVKIGANEYYLIAVKKGQEIRAVKIGPDGKIIQ